MEFALLLFLGLVLLYPVICIFVILSYVVKLVRAKTVEAEWNTILIQCKLQKDYHYTE